MVAGTLRADMLQLSNSVFIVCAFFALCARAGGHSLDVGDANSSCFCSGCLGVTQCANTPKDVVYGRCLPGDVRCVASKRYPCGRWLYRMEDDCAVAMLSSDLSPCVNSQYPLPPTGLRIFEFSAARNAKLACYAAQDLVCNGAARTGVWEGDILGIVLGALRRLKNKYPDQEPVLIDIGGNVGTMALAAWSHGFSVEIFEASPFNMQLLSMTKCLNHADSLSLHFGALGSAAEAGRRCMLLSGHRNVGDFSLNCSIEWDKVPEQQLQDVVRATGSTFSFMLPMQTLDHVFSHDTRMTRDNQVYVMKIDVEGHELEIMSGATAFLSSSMRPHVVVSEVWKSLDAKKLCEIMRKAGYTTVFSFEEGKWIECTGETCALLQKGVPGVDTFVFTTESGVELVDTTSVEHGGIMAPVILLVGVAVVIVALRGRLRRISRSVRNV